MITFPSDILRKFKDTTSKVYTYLYHWCEDKCLVSQLTARVESLPAEQPGHSIT